MSGRMPFTRPSVLLLAVLLSAPAEAGAQSIFDLLQSIRAGGGWIEVPVRDGRGEIETRVLPTAGLVLEGCMQVYAGHSGSWEIRAHDPFGGGRLDLVVAPGEPRVFRYRTAARGQLAVEARWSEPRDTTLFLWVGLVNPVRPGRDTCAPDYGEPAGDPSLPARRLTPT